MAITGQTLVTALHRLAAGLRVAGTDEAAENAWRDFWADVDKDTVRLVKRGDYEWLEALAKHCYEVGFHTGLSKAAALAGKALEEAA